jgi:type II secretory ATPase GspE/PulE/Tfp pilus assembly ATPase PilB-like protein
MPTETSDARPYIVALLQRAVIAAASDLHIEPTASGADIKLRIDGLLKTVESLPADLGRAAVLQLMVRAQLLTYRLDIPQEGRFNFQIENRNSKIENQLDLRLAIMPTAHGLRAAVRLPADLTQPRTLNALGLPPNVLASLHQFAQSDAGMLLVTGPAGSGKTTTIYALLQHIAQTSEGLSIITL